jgi:Cu(I)/Ag(I) efflux system membrane fusion protein
MFVTGVIRVAMADSIVLPQGTVMDTGKRKLVWVESGQNVFVPREITTGARSSAGVQVLTGLKAGEKVAVTGAYLIDSEAQLAGGGEVIPQQAIDQADDLDVRGMRMGRKAAATESR